MADEKREDGPPDATALAAFPLLEKLMVRLVVQGRTEGEGPFDCKDAVELIGAVLRDLDLAVPEATGTRDLLRQRQAWWERFGAGRAN